MKVVITSLGYEIETSMKSVVTKTTTAPAGEDKAEKSQTVGYIVYFIFGIIEILLIFRLVFKLTGANPSSTFVDSIYTITQLFIMPFFGIFPQATGQGVTTASVLEPAALVALVVYAVLAWGLAKLIVIVSGKQE